MLFPSVVEVYIEHNIGVNLFGERLQPSTVASLSPFFLIVFGSLFALIKTWQDNPIVIKNKLIVQNSCIFNCTYVGIRLPEA